MRTYTSSYFLCFLTLAACGNKPGTDEGDDTGSQAADLDQDGFPEGEDCDDSDATTYPGADELCDGVDNDCNGQTDEDAVDGFAAYADEDGDGYGSADNMLAVCELPSGYVLDGTDCDDSNGDVSPGSMELCDGIDNDCDPSSDEMGLASFVSTSGDFVDLQDDLKGSASAPVQYTLAEEGDLQFCGGVYHVNLDVTATSNVVGMGADNTKVTLDGAANGPVIRSSTDGVAFGVENLTLQHGSGEVALFIDESEMGGGVHCYAVDETGTEYPSIDVSLKNIVVKDNTAELGAGLALLGGCSLTVEDAEIRANVASGAAGGIFVISDKDVSLLNTVVEDNLASDGAGGFYYWNISSDGTLGAINFDEVLFASNIADEVAGLVMLGADLIWNGSSSGNSGMQGNNSVDGPGAFALYASDAEFNNVNFGEAGSAYENTPLDIAFEGLGSEYRIGDGASFECASDGICGTTTEHVVTEIGSVTSGGSDGYAGAVFEATWSGTLEHFWTALESSTSDCTTRPYLFTTTETLPENTIASVSFDRLHRGSSQSIDSGSGTELHLGSYIEAGNTYAVVAAWTCNGSSEVDIGLIDLGTMSGDIAASFGTVVGSVASGLETIPSSATTIDLTYVSWPAYVAQSVNTNDF